MSQRSGLYFAGRAIEDLARDELIEAVKILGAAERERAEDIAKLARFRALAAARRSAIEEQLRT